MGLLATSTQLEPTKAALLAALSSLTPPSELKSFVRGAVPSDHVVSPGPVNLPTGGICFQLGAAVVSNSNFASCVYIEEGHGKGMWRFTANTQCYDLHTNKAIGTPIPYPVPNLANSINRGFMVAVGKYIYFGGGTANTPTRHIHEFHRLDTDTGIISALSPFPRGLGRANAVALLDGRLLISAQIVSTIGTVTANPAQTQTSTVFYLVDPVSNVARLSWSSTSESRSSCRMLTPWRCCRAET